MTQRQKIGFDDDQVVSNQRTDRPERYKAKRGRQDRIRIMTPPVRCFGATIKNAKTPFFMYSCADPEDAYKAVVQGDEAAMKRCEAQCPLFKRGYPVGERFACLIYHIDSSQGNRKKDVKQAIPWVFAGDKYVALRNIQKTLPINPRTQKPTPIQAIEILIDCSDDNFQKMTFIGITQPSQLAMTYKECLAACKDEFDPVGDPNGTCGLVEDTIAPESKQNMIRSIERAESGGDDEGQPDEFGTGGQQAPPARGGGRPARPSSRPAPGAEAEVDDSDEFNLGDDVGGDPEPEETPPPAPPQTRKSGPARPGPKAPAKPAANQEDLGFGEDGDIPF